MSLSPLREDAAVAQHLDPDHPPTGSWLVAVVAGLIALAGTLGLWWLADAWAAHPGRANFYALAAAIGGVIVFEFFRFAVTVRGRHRRAVHDQFRLRDVRAEQVNELLEEVAASRQALQAVEAAIEMRVGERNLRARRDRLGRALEEAEDELEAIRGEEHLLDVEARELGLTEESARRLNAALARLEPRRQAGRSVLVLTVQALPLGLGPVAVALLESIEKTRERRRVRKLAAAADSEMEAPSECSAISTSRQRASTNCDAGTRPPPQATTCWSHTPAEVDTNACIEPTIRLKQSSTIASAARCEPSSISRARPPRPPAYCSTWTPRSAPSRRLTALSASLARCVTT